MPKKSVVKSKQKAKLFEWRRVGKWASLSLAGAIFISASFFFYLSFSVLDSNRFMNIMGPLIQKPVIQKEIATDMTNALFEQVDVEKITADALPPKISFLAPAVFGQIKKYTEGAIEAVIKNDKFQTVWNDVLKTTHDGLVTGLREYKGDGTININDLYKKLQKKIDNPKLQFIDGVQLPNSIGNITIIEASWLPIAHNVVANIYAYRTIAITLMLLSVILAIWLSLDKRRAIIQVGLMLAILSAVMLVSVRIARMTLLQSVDSSHLAAANEVWDAVVSPFAWQLVGYAVVSLFVVVVAWLSGSSKSALKFKMHFDQLLAGRLHKALFAKENSLTKWVGGHDKALMITASLLAVALLLFIDLNWINLLLMAIVYILVLTAINVLSPTKKRKK